MNKSIKTIGIAILLTFGLSANVWAQTAAESEWLIKAEIRQLVDDYAIYRDTFNAEGYANLFAEDGEFLFRGQSYKGREVLAERIREADPSVRTMHLMTSSQINILDENNAEGIHYATIYSQQVNPDLPAAAPTLVRNFAVSGFYTDTYVRTDEGWKITSRFLTPLFSPAE